MRCGSWPRVTGLAARPPSSGDRSRAGAGQRRRRGSGTMIQVRFAQMCLGDALPSSNRPDNASSISARGARRAHSFDHRQSRPAPLGSGAGEQGACPSTSTSIIDEAHHLEEQATLSSSAWKCQAARYLRLSWQGLGPRRRMTAPVTACSGRSATPASNRSGVSQIRRSEMMI